MALIKKMDPTEDMESSYSAGENVKWHIYFAETDWQLKKKKKKGKHIHTIRPIDSAPKHHLGNENIYLYKELYVKVHSYVFIIAPNSKQSQGLPAGGQIDQT